MMTKLFWAKVNDPKVYKHKVVPLESPGSEIAVCEDTGEEVCYKPVRFCEVESVVTSLEAARNRGWFEGDPVSEPVEEPQKAEKANPPKKNVKPEPDRPKFCPECGGRRLGRGYVHAEDCSKKTHVLTPKTVETCPTCGGSKKGRGYRHKPDCPDSCKNKSI